jgi:class 3 adenylate cyclase
MHLSSRVQSLLTRYGPLALIAVVGVGLSVGAWYVVREQARRAQTEEAKIVFLRRVTGVQSHLQRQVGRNLGEVYALRDFFNAVSTVSREHFRTFLARSVSNNPALQAMTWSERVTSDERAAYRRRMQAAGFPAFRITGVDGQPLPANHRDVYYPVTYIQPFTGNEVAMGFDSNDRPSERKAIQTAVTRDTLTASGRIRLVQEVDNQYGFVAYLPIYDRQGAQASSAATVRGMAMGVFRVPDLVGVSMRAVGHDADALIYDMSAPAGQRYLGQYEAERGTVRLDSTRRAALERQFQRRCPSPSLCTASIDVAQREWQLRIVPPAGFFQPTGLSGSTFALLLGLLLTGGLMVFTFVRQRHLERVQELAEEVQAEKEKSDRLLLNILPEPVAQELKERGAATPVHHENVSVLFADFVDFTRRAETLPPDVLIDTLDHLFSAFDRIAERHGLEKIKTIGDAYMAAGGVPTPSDTHAQDCVRAGLDMLRYVETVTDRLEVPGEAASMHWEMRVGVSSGPLVAGVLGTAKFAYDVFGDTVVTASRMEACSEPGRLNVSDATHARIADDFACEPRGKVEAKGKGTIEMYFVDAASHDHAFDPAETTDAAPSSDDVSDDDASLLSSS